MSETRGLQTVNEMSEQRLWKQLDSISGRLTQIETRLNELVRLEERVNSHGQALSRYGNRLDNHDRRLQETELWQASYGDKDSVERILSNLQQEVVVLNKKVDTLESNKDIMKGQRDVSKEVLKWVSGILAAILIYKFTRG